MDFFTPRESSMIKDKRSITKFYELTKKHLQHKTIIISTTCKTFMCSGSKDLLKSQG